MEFVVVKELIEGIGSCVVLLILLVHNRDVVDKFGEEGLHPFDRGCELHNFVERPIQLCLAEGAVDLEVLLKASQSRRRVKVFVVQPVKLLVDILVREHEHLKLFRLHQIRTFRHLLDEHAKQVATLL